MSGVESREVGPAESGMRLDRWFRVHFPDLGHGRLQKLLRTGQVRIDGARVRANARLEAGQEVRVPPLGESGTPRERAPRAISDKDAAWVRNMVVYKDDDLMVLDKPSGLAVQGGTSTERHLDGLLDALVLDGAERPRLIHRLDRDTSGVIALARTRAAATELGRAFKTHDVRKVYWALVTGVPRPARGTIDVALVKAGKDGDQRVRPAAEEEEGGQGAITHYATIAVAGTRVAWLALLPVTGRTHQLRAHLAAIGHPIVGDGKYGSRDSHPGAEIDRRLHLHARSLSLPRPGGRTLTVEAPLPEHMARTWAFFGFDAQEAGDPFAELAL
jgi:23S rRNA pseudouridine955/2504/2580 synthase